MCRSMVDIQSPTAEIRRGKKRRRRKKKEERNRMKIYMVSLFHRATINKQFLQLAIGIGFFHIGFFLCVFCHVVRVLFPFVVLGLVSSADWLGRMSPKRPI